MPDTTATHKAYLRPLGLSTVPKQGQSGAPGSGLCFGACEIIERSPGRIERRVVPVAQWSQTLEELAPETREQLEQAMTRLATPRDSFAGLPLDRPHVMGVINVTPDSFSDGGDHAESGPAIAAGQAMAAAGASILDVGGESTRPGAEAVSPGDELRRVIPVIEGLRDLDVKISIDTRRAEVMAAALAAGASIVNDVTALEGDAQSLDLVARSGVPVVLMHMQGTPQTMQKAPDYDDVALDIYDYLEARLEACEAAGIPRARIAVDPGIGFGKTVAHNLQLLEQLAIFHGLGCPILLGVSRKSFIGRISDGSAPKARLPGSLAAGLAGVARGAQILRVHDVAETKQALQVWQAITLAPETAAVGV